MAGTIGVDYVKLVGFLDGRRVQPLPTIRQGIDQITELPNP